MEPLSLQVQGIRPWKSDRPTTIAFLAGEPRTVSADDDPADQASIHQANRLRRAWANAVQRPPHTDERRRTAHVCKFDLLGARRRMVRAP